ncbi:uncharacterized protein LOC133463551 [Cololabis saira]|uniref:uncharacterized protein LOC133463551 n=1 Tax=Cololabis saira TaxID=129043 RepID=UPI002AD26883|nr:uncharacterized protein LOC133463551 [Cololabis saira]
MRSDSFTDMIHASMAFPYVFQLLLSGLIGIHCEIKTVSKVSVKFGGSISIPCLYKQRYRDNVKYLCVGYWWLSCSTVRKTSETEATSGKFFISDDKNQGVFTVTIHNLTKEDTYFFCAVKSGNINDHQHFQLSVNSSPSSLYTTEQKLTAFERGSATVTCESKDSKIAQWCRLGSTCVENPTGSIDGTPVKINTTLPGAFSVTMSDLRRESSGWYWCDNGNLQMPVLITVHHVSTSTTTTSTTTTTTLTSNPTSFAGTIETSTVQPTNPTTKEAGGESLKDEHRSVPKVMIVTITLLVQLLIVLGALFIWRIRRNKAKRKVCSAAEDLNTFDPDVLYSTILHNQHDQLPTENGKRSIIIINDNVQEETATPEERTCKPVWCCTSSCCSCSVIDMAVRLSVLLILTGITVTHSITTLSKVPVRAGASVNIPCQYNPQYRKNVKYLCAGYNWNFCKYATKTNQPQSSGKFLINDVKDQTTFTVTIKNLSEDDAKFWCAVEIDGGPDGGEYFKLLVTKGEPSLYVHRQNVTGFIGENININCSYRNSGEMKWCRLGGECVTKSTETTTIDDSVPNVFTVTVSGLKQENSGWYFCSNGEFQMPVQLNVIERTTTTDDNTKSTATAVTNKENRGPFDLKSLIIPLSLLVFIVIVTSFIFLILRFKKSKAESTSTKSTEEDVIYSDVNCKGKQSVQREAKEENVLYSTLAEHR